MALDLVRSNFVDVVEYPLDPQPLTAPIQEGSVLQLDATQQPAAVNLTDGTNTTIFAGVAMSAFAPTSTLPQVDVFANNTAASGATLTFQLTRVPAATAILVKDTTNNLVYTFNASPSSGQFSVSITTGVLTLVTAATWTNVTLQVQYAFNATLADLRLLQGDLYYGNITPASQTGTIGVVRRGIIYTSIYDVSVDWTAANIVTIKGAANGIFTIGGSGCPINNFAQVINVPNNNVPFLGLFIRA